MNDLIPRGATLSVWEVCHQLGVGRTTFYALVKDKKLVAGKIRRRTVVLQEELQRFRETLPLVGGGS
jgi:excisionase family DNA binding protein